YDAKGTMVREAWDYFPTVDVTLNAGDSVVKGKQATLQALSTLCQSEITQENWLLYAAQLEVLDIPDKDKIIGFWRERFESAPMPEERSEGYEMPQM
ncbi:MAG: hypothetical protein J6P94_02540, partial [Oscillospiraceae bacterium]|nr:hypothetical protein [Oscillospiraceae bacterium]